MRTRTDSHNKSKFYLQHTCIRSYSWADLVLQSPLQFAPSTGKASLPHCKPTANDPLLMVATFEITQAQTVLVYRTTDYLGLEISVLSAMIFDLRASGKSLLSAFQLPHPYGFAVSTEKVLWRSRKPLGRTAIQSPNRHNHLIFSKDGCLFILTLLQEKP